MKSSLSIRRIRIVERPYDVLVTDSTPGKECTLSATYGLGHIPDKGRIDHSAAQTANRGMSNSPDGSVKIKGFEKKIVDNEQAPRDIST